MATLNTANDTFQNAEAITFLINLFAQMIMDGQCSAIVEYVNDCDTLNSPIDFFEWWNDERGASHAEFVTLGNNESRLFFAEKLAEDYVDYLLGN